MKKSEWLFAGGTALLAMIAALITTSSRRSEPVGARHQRRLTRLYSEVDAARQVH